MHPGNQYYYLAQTDISLAQIGSCKRHFGEWMHRV